MVELSVYRASHVRGNGRNRSCLVLQLESAENLKWRRTAMNEAGPSASVNVNEGTHTLTVKPNTVHLLQHYSLFMHNKLKYNWCGDYFEYVWPAQLPVLTWGSSSIPPGIPSMLRSSMDHAKYISLNKKIERRHYSTCEDTTKQPRLFP
jgi:hypothetical protein